MGLVGTEETTASSVYTEVEVCQIEPGGRVTVRVGTWKLGDFVVASHPYTRERESPGVVELAVDGSWLVDMISAAVSARYTPSAIRAGLVRDSDVETFSLRAIGVMAYPDGTYDLHHRTHWTT
jgi:hypothetical protein